MSAAPNVRGYRLQATGYRPESFGSLVVNLCRVVTKKERRVVRLSSTSLRLLRTELPLAVAVTQSCFGL